MSTRGETLSFYARKRADVAMEIHFRRTHIICIQ